MLGLKSTVKHCAVSMCPYRQWNILHLKFSTNEITNISAAGSELKVFLLISIALFFHRKNKKNSCGLAQVEYHLD